MTDFERIDWIEKNMPKLGAIGIAPSGEWQMFSQSGTIAVGSSLRELIDLAMIKPRRSKT